jgi:protein O-GlcNAc transferase
MQELSTDDAMSLYRKGERFRQFNELNAAEEALSAAIKLDENFPEAWNLLALVHQQSWNLEKARECFKMAIKLRTKWSEPYLHLGILEFSMGLFAESADTLQGYVDVGGEDLEALLTLAKAANNLKDCQKVITVTSKIIDIDNDLYEAWELRGLCQAELGRYNAACTSLNMAIDLHPASLTALNTVGNLCYEAENYERAAEFFESSLRVRDNQPEIMFRYGTTLWYLDHWADAIPYLEAYTIKTPDDPKGWNNLGVALREKGDVKRAVECYNRALSLDPGLEIVLKNMGTAKEMQMIP